MQPAPITFCLQVKKISDFTEKLVKQLRAQTKALQVKVTADKDHQQNDELMHVSALTSLACNMLLCKQTVRQSQIMMLLANNVVLAGGTAPW